MEVSIVGEDVETIIQAMDKIKEQLGEGYNQGIDVHGCNWDLWNKK